MTTRVLLIALLLLGGCKTKPLDRASVVETDSDASAVEVPQAEYEIVVGEGFPGEKIPYCNESGPGYHRQKSQGWFWPRRADGHCYESDKPPNGPIFTTRSHNWITPIPFPTAAAAGDAFMDANYELHWYDGKSWQKPKEEGCMKCHF